MMNLKQLVFVDLFMISFPPVEFSFFLETRKVIGLKTQCLSHVDCLTDLSSSFQFFRSKRHGDDIRQKRKLKGKNKKKNRS